MESKDLACLPQPSGPLPDFMLGMMRHHVWVRDPRDDWAGVTDVARRRKLQNKLHQRAYRYRKQQQKHDLVPPEVNEQPSNYFIPAYVVTENSRYRMLCAPVTQPGPADSGYTGIHDIVNNCIGYRLFERPEHRVYVQHVARQAYEAYMLRSPRPSHLQVLIRLNVLNAIARNALLMGIPIESLCRDEMVSPLGCHGPHAVDSPASTGWLTCPEALRPTKIQCKIAHHPWIDLLPFPRMRDNFLVVFTSGIYDEDEICTDLLDVNEDGADMEKASLIVWGDPWDPRGWEATQSFWIKWGWLMRGCTELFEATNNWRSRRGEKKIDFTCLS